MTSNKNTTVDVIRASYLEGKDGVAAEPLFDSASLIARIEKATDRSVRFAAPALVVGVMAPTGFRLGRAVKTALARRHKQPIIVESPGEASMTEAA